MAAAAGDARPVEPGPRDGGPRDLASPAPASLGDDPGTSAAAAPARRIPVLFGPTAVGKTALALALAEDLDGEIVSLDSRQMVRGMDIGTAKPTALELARVRHHLIDIVDPDETPALGQVQALVLAAIADILGRGRLPILAGGAGQYLRAVLEGWSVPAVPPDAALRARLAEEAACHGAEALHARLRQQDPAAAARIDARNLRRTIRALEVIAHSGRPFSEQSRKLGPPHPWLIVALSRPRELLYARADARVQAMLDAGLEAEVRGLLAAGHGWELPALQSVGYQEWAPHLTGDIDRAELVRRIQHGTRRLIRSQDSWLRSLDLPTLTLDLGDTESGIAEVERVRGALAAA